MSRLLNAGFSRLFKSKIFWLSVVVTMVIQLIGSAAEIIRGDISLDDMFFQFVPNVQVYAAVFTSLFFGREYSDGAIRNKIICGHTRTEIFMTNFALSAAAGEIIFLTGVLSGFCAVPFIGFFKMTASDAVMMITLGMLGIIALSAVLTAFEMLITSSRANVLTIIHVIVLIIISGSFYSWLCEPETEIGAIITAESGFTFTEPMPNPNYVTEPMRSVLRFFVSLTPEGQAILIYSRGADRPIIMAVCCLCVTAAALCIGTFFFKRKNIK